MVSTVKGAGSSKWSKYVKWEGAELSINMMRKPQDLSDEFLEWVGTTIGEKREEGEDVAVSSIDLSGCNLDNDGLSRIVDLLEMYNVPCHRLKLYQNDISDVEPICRFLDCFAGQEIREIHLSHNQLDDDQCATLVQKCAELGPNPTPIWLRIEHNPVQDPNSVVDGLTAPQVAVAPGLRGVEDETSVAIHHSFFPDNQAPECLGGKKFSSKGGKKGKGSRKGDGASKGMGKGASTGFGGKNVIKTTTKGQGQGKSGGQFGNVTPHVVIQQRQPVMSRGPQAVTPRLPFGRGSIMGAPANQSYQTVRPAAVVPARGAKLPVPTRERPIVSAQAGQKRQFTMKPEATGAPAVKARKVGSQPPTLIGALGGAKKLNFPGVKAGSERKIPVPPGGKKSLPPTSKAASFRPITLGKK